MIFCLPNIQKINVSHPPTIYLIETVFESIKFVSTEQLSGTVIIDIHIN
jgi:hypothetical protein